MESVVTLLNAPEAVDARRLIRRGQTASLATIDSGSGDPHVSLVTTATGPDGAPILLLSALATHTRNLDANPRASLLFQDIAGHADPLEGSRITVTGELKATDEPTLHRRFLAKNPSSELYAGFADFAFYHLTIERGFFVGGFGRIRELESEALILPIEPSQAIADAEAGIVAHMNEDHADAVALYATRLLGAEPGPWQMVGCDCEGCDLRLNDAVLRLDFPSFLTGPDAIRQIFIKLAKDARNVENR